MGFVYHTGLAAQWEGRNVLLPRNLLLEDGAPPDALAQQLGETAVPLQELVDAVQGTAESLRYRVLDAAYAHPVLAPLPQRGLLAQPPPAGLMALFSSAPGAVAEVPAAAPLAASRFGRELVRSLVTPRLNGRDVLRLTRGAVLDASGGQQAPWLAGDNHDREDFAQAGLLDMVIPRTPEDLARQALRRSVQLGAGGSAGEQPVSQILQAAAPRTTPFADTGPDDGPRQNASQSRGSGTAASPPGGALPAALPGAIAAGAAAVAVAGAAGEAAWAVAGVPQETPGAGFPALPAPAAAPSPAALAALRLASSALAAADSAQADGRTQPVRGGGERPAYAPKVNPHGYAKGDSYTYRVLDTWKGEVVGSLVQSVEQVMADGELLLNGSQMQMDAQGRIKRAPHRDGGQSEFQPAQELRWAHPQRGQSRDVRFKELVQRCDGSVGQAEWRGSLSVGRLRWIETPASEFDALPIEGSGWYYDRGRGGGPQPSGQWYRTVWNAPRLGRPVAIDLEDTNALGKLLRRERVELTSAQTARMLGTASP